MWLSLYNLAEVDDPSDEALASFARRQLKIDALSWISAEMARLIIEPLRAMCDRAGYKVPSNVKRDQAMASLIKVQFDRLFPEGTPATLQEWARKTPAYDVSNGLGQMLRDRKAANA